MGGHLDLIQVRELRQQLEQAQTAKVEAEKLADRVEREYASAAKGGDNYSATRSSLFEGYSFLDVLDVCLMRQCC